MRCKSVFTSHSLRTHLQFGQGVRLQCNHMGGRNWWQNCHSALKRSRLPGSSRRLARPLKERKAVS